MITKADCMSMLLDLEKSGHDVNKYITDLVLSNDIPEHVLKYLAANKELEIAEFYEILRQNHNRKKSPLYTNIVKEVKVNDPEQIILTLSSLLTQIALHAKKMSNPSKFYKEARADEIVRAMQNYFINQDLSGCLQVLNAIRVDLLTTEYLRGKRNIC